MAWMWLVLWSCRGFHEASPATPPVVPTGDTGPVVTCPVPDPVAMRLEADIQFGFLDPCALEPAATQLCDLRSHAVGYRNDLPWRDELFLFLPPGPGVDTLRVRRWAAFAGFRAVVLGYVNDGDLSDACRGTDGTCHAAWREETHAGVDVSSDLEVGPTDGIEVRLLAALTHLAREDPDREWSDFLTASGGVRWSRVVASGWSIGAGQAAYLAHQRPLAGLVLLSGPKDQATVQGVDGPAPWISQPMQVPGESSVRGVPRRRAGSRSTLRPARSGVVVYGHAVRGVRPRSAQR